MNPAKVALPAPSPWRRVQEGGEPAWLVGVAACGPPYRLGGRWLAELLVVGDPLPPARLRPQLFPALPGVVLRLCWRSVAGLAYPSPRHLEIVRCGAVLYDPWGVLAENLGLLAQRLRAQGLHLPQAVPASCWPLEWPGEPLPPTSLAGPDRVLRREAGSGAGFQAPRVEAAPAGHSQKEGRRPWPRRTCRKCWSCSAAGEQTRKTWRAWSSSCNVPTSPT